jgi:hypothetical protein
MPTFSFTEKEWDKVRPSSVKKTGVSEAMRQVLKGVPKDLKALSDEKECDKAADLLDELIKVFVSAEALVKKAKDDKHGAAGKLKAWTTEAQDGRKMIVLHKEKQIYAAVNKAADQKLQDVLDSVEKTTKEAAQQAAKILQDVKKGQDVDVEKYSKDQQNYRGVLRNAKEAVTKKGFINLVKFLNDFHKTGLDPGKIEIPACVKTIESKLGTLEQAVDALGDAMSQAVEQQGSIKATGALADESRQVLDEYKASYKKIKALAGKGKQLQAKAKQAVAVLRSTKAVETSKMLALVSTLHDLAQEYEEAVLKEGYRSRNTKDGELHLQYAALTKKPGFDESLNKPFREWRATLFDALRLCTMPAAAVKKDVDDCVELLIGIGGTTASQAESLAKRVEADRQKTAKTYGSAVA